MGIVWDGITRSETLRESAVAVRSALADAAKGYDWGYVLELLVKHNKLVNACRPGGREIAVCTITSGGSRWCAGRSRTKACRAWGVADTPERSR